jgi:hypothetical protein
MFLCQYTKRIAHALSTISFKMNWEIISYFTYLLAIFLWSISPWLIPYLIEKFELIEKVWMHWKLYWSKNCYDVQGTHYVKSFLWVIERLLHELQYTYPPLSQSMSMWLDPYLTPKVLWWFQAQNCLISSLLKSSYSIYFFEFFFWIQL